MGWNALKQSLREMSRLRQALLAVLVLMAAGFAIAIGIAYARPGFAYQGDLLCLSQADGVRVFSGRVDGEKASFTLQPDGAILYRRGEDVYGPYTLQEDPTARPSGTGPNPGVEIRRGGEDILFRGSWYGSASSPVLVDEHGETHLSFQLGPIGIFSAAGDESWFDWDGRRLSEYELHEPPLTALLQLFREPELTHRGSFLLYVLGTLLAALTVFHICCPKLIFRWSIMWHVQDPDAAEPSEWHLFWEKVGWVALTAAVAWLYWMALTVIA